MSPPRGYSRVYYELLTDPKFDGVRDNLRLLGGWLVLLLHADMTWPHPTYLPPGVPPAVLRALAEHDLIELMGAGRYRVKGLDNERRRRAGTARENATARWSQSNRRATAEQPQSNRHASTRTSTSTRTSPKTSPSKAAASSSLERLGDVLKSKGLKPGIVGDEP